MFKSKESVRQFLQNIPVGMSIRLEGDVVFGGFPGVVTITRLTNYTWTDFRISSTSNFQDQEPRVLNLEEQVETLWDVRKKIKREEGYQL